MKTKILAGLLLAGSAAFAAPRISFGIGFGAPAPYLAPAYVAPGPYAAAMPPCPGPGYQFINGYWQNVRGPFFRHDDDDYYRYGFRGREHFEHERFEHGRWNHFGRGDDYGR